MTRNFIIILVRTLFYIFTNLEIIGAENIPDDKRLVIVGNHIGTLDAMLVLAVKKFTSHPNLLLVVAEKHENNPVYRWAVKHLNFLFIDRFNPDIRTLRKVIQRMENNGMLVIAPEGTRSPTGGLIEGKQGAAYLAAKSGATLVPITTVGTKDMNVKAHLKKFKRTKIILRIGKPFEIPILPNRDRSEFLAKQTEEIMCQIASYLPESYRGVYTDHPRLKELLQGQEILSP